MQGTCRMRDVTQLEPRNAHIWEHNRHLEEKPDRLPETAWTQPNEQVHSHSPNTLLSDWTANYHVDCLCVFWLQQCKQSGDRLLLIGFVKKNAGNVIVWICARITQSILLPLVRSCSTMRIDKRQIVLNALQSASRRNHHEQLSVKFRFICISQNRHTRGKITFVYWWCAIKKKGLIKFRDGKTICLLLGEMRCCEKGRIF